MMRELAAARQALAASTDPENRELAQHLEAAEGLEGQVVALLEEADPSLRKQLESRLERVQAIVLEDRRKMLVAAEALAIETDLQALGRSGNAEDQREAKRCRRSAARAEKALAIAGASPRSARAVEFADLALRDFQADAARVRQRKAARGVKDRRGPGTYMRAYARMILNARAPLVQVSSGARPRESRPAQRRGTRAATGAGDRAGPGDDQPPGESDPGDVGPPRHRRGAADDPIRAHRGADVDARQRFKLGAVVRARSGEAQ